MWSEPKVGDEGQRYEVCCKDSGGKEIKVGWSDDLEGAGAMCEGIRLHPSFHSPKIIDRKGRQKVSKNEFNPDYENNPKVLKGVISDLQIALEEAEKLKRPDNFPEIVCLCGSTRFTAEMLVLQWELTKQGKIVLSWCALPDSYYNGKDKAHIGDKEGVKETVDVVHLRKIDLADSVFVLNVGGYIGESTRNEINYAQSLNKPIHYLEQALKGGKAGGDV